MQSVERMETSLPPGCIAHIALLNSIDSIVLCVCVCVCQLRLWSQSAAFSLRQSMKKINLCVVNIIFNYRIDLYILTLSVSFKYL